MRYHSGVKACREHPNFFKVKLYSRTDTRLKAPIQYSTLRDRQTSQYSSDGNRLFAADFQLRAF